MNHTMVAGHVSGEPEVRQTGDGAKVTTLRLASNTRRGSNEETTWWRRTIAGNQFDGMLKYVKKGSALMAFGEMAKPRIYTDREGQPQMSIDLTVRDLRFPPFGRGGEQGNAQQQPNQQHAPQMATTAPTYGSAPEAMPTPEDEIPF